MQHINSTPVGGGVAEILTRLVPLLRELGVEASWDVIKGDQAFFNVTKAFHNALHGKPEEITEEMFEIFRANTEMNLREVNFTGDVICDPRSAAGRTDSAEEGRSGRQWVWRCHIDVSAPQPDVWEFLRPYIEQYDAAIFSMPDFAQRLPIAQFRVAPSIDPLSDKNKPLDEKRRPQACWRSTSIDPGRPVLTQISRFDRLKDPLGVIAAYRMVKKRHKCQLVLAGGGATDDPEGEEVLREVQEAAANDPDIHVLSAAALQRPGDQRAGARLHRGDPKVDSRRLRPDRERGAVEEKAGDRRRGGRHQVADHRRRDRLPGAFPRRLRQPHRAASRRPPGCASEWARTATSTSSRTFW